VSSASTPTMPASMLAERVSWVGSASVSQFKVAEVRPECVPPNPAVGLVHVAGHQMRCDLWFPHEPVTLGHDQDDKPSVLVMTS
jgi:hypothetical protein